MEGATTVTSSDTDGPLSLEFYPYRRPFQSPLNTHHGQWTHREGILVRVQTDAGQTGYGEIAPVPWFGSETFSAALAFCQQLPKQVNAAQLRDLPQDYPACQFGWESAIAQLTRSHASPLVPAKCLCALLPAGQSALSAWSALWAFGHRTFKWKIGVGSIDSELTIFGQLIEQLPDGARLRLDANGGLDASSCRRWLSACDMVFEKRCDRDSRKPLAEVEFLEQPMSVAASKQLCAIAADYQTPLALDESVSGLDDLQRHLDSHWPGVFVLKPAILGSPYRLRALYREQPFDWVMSSVFETAIGRRALFDLADDLHQLHPNRPSRALGMGTEQWLPLDGLNSQELPADLSQVWRRSFELTSKPTFNADPG